MRMVCVCVCVVVLGLSQGSVVCVCVCVVVLGLSQDSVVCVVLACSLIAESCITEAGQRELWRRGEHKQPSSTLSVCVCVCVCERVCVWFYPEGSPSLGQ